MNCLFCLHAVDPATLTCAPGCPGNDDDATHDARVDAMAAPDLPDDHLFAA